MKKIALGTMMISSVLLASCSLTGKKPKNPEEIIKKTQTSFIESLQDNVLAKKQVDVNGSLKLNVASPFGKGNGILAYDGKGSQEQAEVNLNLTGSFNVQGQSGNIDLSSSFIVTLDKIYMKLSKLKVQLPDPSLQAYLAMAQMITNKWFYLEIQTKSEQLSLKLKNLDLKKQFEEHSIFKVNKVIEDKKYNVSLNKDNLASIAYNVSKQINSNFTGTKQEILTGMKNTDLTGVLTIKQDSYFTFSGSMTNGLQNIPFEFRYLKDKLYLKTQGIVFDINKDGDKFNGTVSIITQAEVKFNIDGKLNEKTFELNMLYDKDPVKANASFIYNAKKVDKIDIKIPENATNLQDMIQKAFGGSLGGNTGLPNK